MEEIEEMEKIEEIKEVPKIWQDVPNVSPRCHGQKCS